MAMLLPTATPKSGNDNDNAISMATAKPTEILWATATLIIEGQRSYQGDDQQVFVRHLLTSRFDHLEAQFGLVVIRGHF